LGDGIIFSYVSSFLCHGINITLFLVTKLITLVKKLFNTTHNDDTSFVLLFLKNTTIESKLLITVYILLLKVTT